MPDQNQVSSNEALFAKLAETLSPDRIGRYLTATGYDKQRALALYLWNAKIGEAFHVPIQAVEVGLRNRITVSLADLFGSEWWRHNEFKIAIDEDRAADLETVLPNTQPRANTGHRADCCRPVIRFLGRVAPTTVQSQDLGLSFASFLS
jgi:hypothetical protein